MSTRFHGEGNIGSEPEFHEFPSDNDEPHRLLRLNVYFDNPVPTKDGRFEDRGGFWAQVEIWHRDAERMRQLYRKGMRISVQGREIRDEWQDREDNPRVTFKIQARPPGILPYRIESIVMAPKSSNSGDEQPTDIS